MESRDDQKTTVTNLLKTPLKKDDAWYLIDATWWKQWKLHVHVGYDSWDTNIDSVGKDSARPGPIDNSPLFKEGSQDVLQENLIDELEYVLVPVEAWTKLLSWYGITEGQKPIVRYVIEQGMFVKHCKVEVYLMTLKLTRYPQVDNFVSFDFSRANTTEDIEMKMRQVFNIDANKPVRMWNKYIRNTYEALEYPERTVQDAGLYHNQVIMIEEQNDDGKWPRNLKR